MESQVNTGDMCSMNSEGPEIIRDGSQEKRQHQHGLKDTNFQGFQGHVWTPGLLRAFPHRGVWALFGCVAGLVASVVVVVKSDDRPGDWFFSPSVYLALFMTLTNMLARFAFHDGVKITWWRKALQGGTIDDLHTRWTHADGFWSALFAGRSFTFVSLASLAVTFIAIDQPLIQRASSIVTVKRTAPIHVTASIAPEIPWGFTSVQNDRGVLQQIMTQPMISALNDYNSQLPIETGFAGCSDQCTGFVEAGGLAARCNSTTGPIEYFDQKYQRQYVRQEGTPFSVDFDFDTTVTDSPPQIVVKVAYSRYLNSSGSKCAAIRTERTCLLTSATVRYPVTLTGDTIALGDILTNGRIQSFQPPNPRGEATGDWSRYTLGGIFLAAKTLFASNATYEDAGGIGYTMTLPDTLSSQFLDLPQQNMSGVTSMYNLTYPGSCTSSWTDPTSHILTSLNTMAFMLSLSASEFPFRNTSAAPKAQFVAMSQTTTVNLYRADYKYLVASVVLTFVLVLLIMPTFAGWWELGRSVTLSPLETAKAFDAPLLRGPGSNAPLTELVKAVGSREVRWAELERFGNTDDRVPVATGRLVLADPAEVVRPRKGEIYT